MRKVFIGFMLSALLLALTVPAQAQQPGKVPRIAVISNNPGAFDIAILNQDTFPFDVAARNNVITPYMKKIAELAIRDRLPSMLDRGDYAQVGGLIWSQRC